jgi:serine/threonine protein kinase
MTSQTTAKAKNQELLGDAEFDRKWDLESQFTFIRKSNDPRFGEISLYKSKTGNDMIFAKEKLVTAKQQASNDIRDLKSRQALNHKNIQKVLGYSTTTQKELCSTNYLTKAFYEFPKSDLHKGIEEKRQNGQVYSTPELQNIGNQALQGLNHLHNLEISHGDVRPLNIGLNRDTDGVQILDRLNNPAPAEQVQNKNIVENKDLYMSPELYRKLQGKDKTVKCNPYKEDLYGLGLSLLQAGTGEKVQNVYKPGGNFDQNALDQHLQNFDQKHAGNSPHLSKFVHALLNSNEGSRLTAKEYVDKLSRIGDTSTTTTTTTTTNSNLFNMFGTNQTKVNSAPPEESTTTTVYYEDKPQTTTTYQDYIKKEPTVTTYSSAPETTVHYYEEPAKTYVYNRPSHIVESTPTTTYVSSPTTYIQNPTIYTPSKSVVYSSPPVTTYTTAPLSYTTAPITTYTTAPVTTYETFSKPLEPQTTHYYQSEAPSDEGERSVTVQRADGTSFLFKTRAKVDSNMSLADFDTHDPRNGGDGVETGTRVQPVVQNVFYEKPAELGLNSGNTVYSVQSPQILNTAPVVKSVRTSYTSGGNVVYSTPTYELVDHHKNSVFVNSSIPESNVTYTTAPGTTYTVQNSGPAKVTYYQSHTVQSPLPIGEPYTQVRYATETYTPAHEVIQTNPGFSNVEVRRSYSSPQEPQRKVIQTHYVVEGDKIIEVNDDK